MQVVIAYNREENYTFTAPAECAICPIMDFDRLSSYHQLQPMERAFVDAYLSDIQGSAAKAGKRIIEFIRSMGVTDDGSSVLTRFRQYHAERLFERPIVQAAIAERVADLCRQMDIDAYKTLKETSVVAMSSIAHYFDFERVYDYGSDSDRSRVIARLDRATPEQLSAISSIKVTDKADGSQTIEVKMHDKLKALDMLMRYQGLYDADNAQRAGINGRPVEPARITNDMSVEDSAALYARQIAEA